MTQEEIYEFRQNPDIVSIDYIIDRYKYFKENNLEGDEVDQVVNLLWSSEENYGNPYELTEDEFDDILRPIVEHCIKNLPNLCGN